MQLDCFASRTLPIAVKGVADWETRAEGIRARSFRCEGIRLCESDSVMALLDALGFIDITIDAIEEITGNDRLSTFVKALPDTRVAFFCTALASKREAPRI